MDLFISCCLMCLTLLLKAVAGRRTQVLLRTGRRFREEGCCSCLNMCGRNSSFPVVGLPYNKWDQSLPTGLREKEHLGISWLIKIKAESRVSLLKNQTSSCVSFLSQCPFSWLSPCQGNGEYTPSTQDFPDEEQGPSWVCNKQEG